MTGGCEVDAVAVNGVFVPSLTGFEEAAAVAWPVSLAESSELLPDAPTVLEGVDFTPF